ncbi:MAG: histidine kinase [Pyrinomonadaceae bacterium]|nr:histidine kinase [Pyrinomonadaceae bacterium]
MMRERFIQRRLVSWSVIFACWTLYGIFFASQVTLHQVFMGYPVTWRDNFAAWLLCGYLWAMLTPPILYLSRRYPIERRNWPRRTFLHLACSLVAVALLLGVYILAAKLVGLPVAQRKPLGTAFLTLVILEYHFSLLVYWIILGIDHALRYYRKYKERELQASQLETRLAQAQLQVLKMQLHPHFLFNTLHAISTLMHRDVDAADRMIARLSDLLRLALENEGVQEVTLKQELELLERYLEIEQTRFRDRLMVEITIEPEVLDARVPNLILQPIVENAIQHGIARRRGQGRIEIGARRTNGTLSISVRDDGRGLISGAEGMIKEGVGLSNTRARLSQLYGASARFELYSAPEGGTLASLLIPFHEDERGFG